jgi:hypothetical protein
VDHLYHIRALKKPKKRKKEEQGGKDESKNVSIPHKGFGDTKKKPESVVCINHLSVVC